MMTLSCLGIVVLLASLTNFVCSLPLETTLNCVTGEIVQLGQIEELYSGDLEIFPNPPDVETEFETLCTKCAEFLELITSDTNTTIRTKKPFDAEALKEVDGVVSYQIKCGTGVNGRTLTVIDVNDNAPVFDKEEYRASIPETFPVGESVLQVKAVDADVSPGNSHITYSIQPPSTTFEASSYGEIILREMLNYTVSHQYNITVKAQDRGGLFNETRVLINIIDTLSPQFEHDAYEASIPENQVAPVLEVLPAPIKANTTGNHTVIYSISDVSPSDFWHSFSVDQRTGVVTVITGLDFEEIEDSITVHVKASLDIDSTRTANTTLMVHVEDVNEAPVFSVKLHIAEIFSVAQSDSHVVQVKATDPDVPESETLQYSLVELSSMFAVEPSNGQVYVVSVEGQSGKVTLHVKAIDPHGLHDTTTVEVTIKESSSKDVVVISLNQEIGTVQNKTTEMEKALERALGWSVTIISVSTSRQELALSRTPDIHSVHRENTPRTFVSFIATEINGTNVIPKETVQTKLLNDGDEVLKEMQQVFGPDVTIDVETGDDSSDKTLAITLGIIIPLVVIIAVCVMWGLHRHRKEQNRRTEGNRTEENRTEDGDKISLQEDRDF